MTKTRLSLLVAAIVCAFSTVFFGAVLARALWYAPEAEIPAEEAVTAEPALLVSSSSDRQSLKNVALENIVPTRIVIPSIDLDAHVQKVGITYKGNVGTPNNYTDAGWYKYGTVPGELGGAVIDGHVDNGLSLPGVFGRLKEVRIGDKVTVRRADGTEVNFVVTDIDTYHYLEVPMDEILHRNDRAYLRLITCDGEWVPSAGTDEKRLVVTAIRVDGV